MPISDIIDLLKITANTADLTLHQGADEALIKKCEETYGIKLPDDFKEFYRFTNGFETEEDLFNMSPLDEIIGYREWQDGFIRIAEYMIYSDYWELEIDPIDHNKYKIVGTTYAERLTLTNSLEDFLNHFLAGGLFKDGGLYNWADQIIEQFAISNTPKDHSLFFNIVY